MDDQSATNLVFMDDNDDDSVASTGTVVSTASTNSIQKKQPKLDTKSAMEITRNLGLAINQIRDKDRTVLLLGACLKLEECARGNELSDSTLEETLINHLSLFTRTMPVARGGSQFSQFSQLSQSSQTVARSSVARPSGKENHPNRNGVVANMKRVVPIQQGACQVKRLRSANERMLNSNQQPNLCAMCLETGHRAGSQCPIVSQHQSEFIGHTKTKEFAASIGNKTVFKVEWPTTEDQRLMAEWLDDDGSDNPSTDDHIVITKCFHSADPNASSEYSVVRAILLEAG